MAWKDVSWYDPDDNDRIPTCMLLEAFGNRTLVHRHRDFRPNEWLLSSTVLRLENLQLTSITLDAAQKEAEAILRTILGDLIVALDK